ncbi:MAG: helix-turn-helix domain-containing GNAT family N-acetyltransferase [Bacteroidales bacterium]
MKFIQELGPVAFGNRMKNISDDVMKDIQKIFKELNMEFEPRWFTIFQLLLKKKGEMQITQISEALDLTHPAVIQVVNKLHEKKLVDARTDNLDRRKRMVKLSAKGKDLALRISPVWEDLRRTAYELIDEMGVDLIEVITRMEDAFNRESLYKRMKKRIIERYRENTKLIDYDPRFKEDFRRINERWLNETLGFSAYDRALIDNPPMDFADDGARVYLMLYGDSVVGSFIIGKIDEHIAELNHLVIVEEYRGWGLGEKLLDHAIRIAGREGFIQVIAFLHKKLPVAKALFARFGFVIEDDKPLKDFAGRDSELMKYDLEAE